MTNTAVSLFLTQIFNSRPVGMRKIRRSTDNVSYQTFFFNATEGKPQLSFFLKLWNRFKLSHIRAKLLDDCVLRKKCSLCYYFWKILTLYLSKTFFYGYRFFSFFSFLVTCIKGRSGWALGIGASLEDGGHGTGSAGRWAQPKAARALRTHLYVGFWMYI